MKRNFLTTALMVTALFLAATIAQAADVTFGGQVLTRYEINEQHDFDDDTGADDFTQSRVRLNANVNVNDSTSAFIQLNSNRRWGNSAGAVAATGANPNGDGNASFTANDRDASVGITQAYFTLNNFATLPVDLKVGKQQIIWDGHRLFGNTIWTMGQQNHDAMRLSHKHDNMSIEYAWIIGAEDGAPTGNNADDRNDVEVHAVHAGYQGILGGKLTATYAYIDDGCGSAITAACNNLEDSFHTIGFRQAGQLFGIDYRGEYFYQWGDATATAATASTAKNANANRVATVGTNVDRNAFMFGARIGKAFNNVAMKPSLTLWYDHLSGTSDNDLDNNNYKSFNTLFDTGHKFYGLMDNFLGVGTGSSATGTSGLGLQDIAVKAKLSPVANWTLNAHYHWFRTAEGIAGSPQAGLNGQNTIQGVNYGNAEPNNNLGNELDLTLVNKYNANTNIVFGFSNYTTTSAYRDLRNVVGDGANWAYLQFDVKF